MTLLMKTATVPTIFALCLIPGIASPTGGFHATGNKAVQAERALEEDLVWLADSYIELWPDPTSKEWNWGNGVLMYGLLRTAEVTGDQNYLTYVRRFFDAHIDENGNLDVSILYPDKIAPGIATFGMLLHTGEERYRTVCDRLADWLMLEAPRSKNGGWFHFPIVDWQYIDTLYMTTIFLAAYGRYTDQDEYLSEALLQHNLLAENLYSRDANLYWHGWDEDGLLSFWATPWRLHNTAFWGRGNGWVAGALARVLALTGPEFPGYEEARGRLEDHLQRLWDLQDPDSGHWYTVVDVPGELCNYSETTATALIVEASLFSARRGLTPAPSVELISIGLEAIRGRLVPDLKGRARLTGASIGTSPGGYWYYVLTPTFPDRPWGVGATLLAFSEYVEQYGE